MQIKFIISAKR